MQVVSTLCDLCHAERIDTPAVETVTLTINKRGTELDVCQSHHDEINARLEDLFEVGRRPGNLNLVTTGKPTKTKEGEFGCDRCTRSFATLQGLSMHRTRTHKLQSATKEATRKREAKAALTLVDGHPQLPDGLDPEEATRIIDSGWCIFDSSHGPFHGRSNVATHLRKMHGVSITALGLANPTGSAAHAH